MKKVYDRKKSEYISQEEHDRRYSKRPKDICRGGKEHDYVLVLPQWVRTDARYKFDPRPYYEAMEALKAFQKHMSSELADRGIVFHSHYGLGSNARQYVCSVCKKQDYRYEKE